MVKVCGNFERGSTNKMFWKTFVNGQTVVCSDRVEISVQILVDVCCFLGSPDMVILLSHTATHLEGMFLPFHSSSTPVTNLAYEQNRSRVST